MDPIPRRRPAGLLLPWLLAIAACSSTQHVADLATNDLFYVDVPFRTKAPGDRRAFVAPLADARATAALPAHEKGFPIVYAGDEFWDRPVAEMAGEILQRQLGASGLFAGLQPGVSDDALLIVPSLVQFLGGTIEAMSGCRAFADVGLRVQVYGPVGAGGERPLWHDQVYFNRQATGVELAPPSPYRLFGRSLQVVMTKLLSGLDGSQVARSGVPVVGAPAAVEAAAPAR